MVGTINKSMFQFNINAKLLNGGKYSTLFTILLKVTMNMNTNKCKFITKYKCVGHNYVEKISNNICFSMSAHSICTGNSSKIKTSPVKI